MIPQLFLLYSTVTALSSTTPPPSQTTTTPPTPSSGPPPPKIQNLTTPDTGYTYGNLILHNWCPYPLYLRSVGAHYLGGPRDGTHSGWGTPEDDVMHTLPSHASYTEPLRLSGSCPYTGLPPYCPLEDKLAGQAISLKLSRTPSPSDTNITQIEYALYKNPHTPDTFPRLYYDVSLLDCAAPEALHPDLLAKTNVTDFSATGEMWGEKERLCPGYEGGVAVSFGGDGRGKNCPPVYCEGGGERCVMVYAFDRTRRVEASFTCEREYRGEVRVDLCVGRGDEGAKSVVDGFGKWAKTATHEVLMLQLGKTASATVASSTGAAVAQTTASGSLGGGDSSIAPTTLSSSIVGASNTSGTG